MFSRLNSLRVLVAAVAIAALASPAPASVLRPQERVRRTGQGEENLEARPFSIPDTQYAKALYERAQGHISASRWSEALSDLQQLIEEHRDDVLPARRTDRTGRKSQQPLHPGAAEEARARLLSLPAEARKRYSDRYGGAAEEALHRARSNLDRGALVEVGRRWPVTPAAAKAWLSLGDLECELGNWEAARGAWRRASLLGDSSCAEGARSRLEWVASASAEGSFAAEFPIEDAGSGSADLRLPGPGEARGTPPGTDSHTWPSPVRIDEESPFSGGRSNEAYNLFPIVYGDLVLVSNTMRLFAIEAFSGDVRWQSPEPPGWGAVRDGALRQSDLTRTVRNRDNSTITVSHFFEGVDRDSLVVAPAASGGIVVAAHQIPVTQTAKVTFQGQIPITTIIPDRRLFAYEIESGRLLWNHLPPPLWDGESGSFSQRMRVAGPPVITGTRLLVPTYRLQGRIDYHVACYDLSTGHYLWSTSVIGGQRPLNMFGRHELEFAAPPLRVEGERLIALTQLGAVACLDLYTGEILWETLYDQIALPSADGIRAGERPRVWNNAPPVVSGGKVLATPEDCPDLVCFDLETGALLWSYPANQLADASTRYGATLSLIGASEDTVYLAGRTIQSLQAVGGFQHGRGPGRYSQSGSPLGDIYSTSAPMPRPILTERHVLVPATDGRVALDRLDLGREDPLLSGAWGAGRRSAAGNAVLAHGALFVLSNQSLTAFFDWQTIEERLARDVQKNPGNAALAARFGSFLEERAEAEVAAVRPRNALAYCARARDLLEPLLEHKGGGRDTAVAERLHEVLRLEARVLIDDAQSALALERLARAKDLAPDRERLCDTLLELITVQEGRDTAAWIGLLDELERECGTRVLSPDKLLELSRKSARAFVGRAAAGFASLQVSDATLPGAEDEAAGLETGTSAAGKTASPPMPVGLWVLHQRLREHAGKRDLEAEFADLHAILERYGNVLLLPPDRESPGETVSRRIRARLDQGASAAYAPYEARARAMLDQALADDDRALLDSVAERFPHSEAARDAREARLAAAFGDQDVTTVAQVVLSEISPRWTPAASTPRESRLVLMLARTLEARGNPEYIAGLLAVLAREHPDQTVDLPGLDGRTLAELANTSSELAVRPLPADLSSFASPYTSPEPLRGENVLLGALVPSPASGAASSGLTAERRLIFARRDKLLALSSADPSHEAWGFPLVGGTRPREWRDTSFLSSQRVVLAEAGEVRAIEAGGGAADGSLAWSWSLAGEEVLFLSGGDGVCLSSLAQDGQPTRLVALDLATGVELWELRFPIELWPAPVCGGGRLVLLPKLSSDRRALVVQLATGTGAVELEIEGGVSGEDRRGAWIENDTLVLPHFTRTTPTGGDAVVAYDLAGGRRAWHVAADDSRELDSIVRCGETYLILNGSPGPARVQSGMILQLDTRLGAVRPIQGVHLSPGDVPIGVRQNSVTELGAPYLFLRSPASGGRETLVRAIHLPYGQRWVHRLPLAEQDIYTQLMPLPALSESTVALVYTEENRPRIGRVDTETRLLLLDKSSGLPRGSQVLDAGLGTAQNVVLEMLGNSLVLSGRDQISVFERELPGGKR